MHEIVASHPQVAAADQALAELEQAKARYEDHLEKVRAEYTLACRQADQDAEPRPPLPAHLVRPGPDFMQERRQLGDARRETLGKVATDLAPKLSDRYDAAMKELAAVLEPALGLADEIASLVQSYASVVSGQLTWLNKRHPQRAAHDPSVLQPLPDLPHGQLEIIEAALHGSRLMPEVFAAAS
jgi:hypothetical protein